MNDTEVVIAIISSDSSVSNHNSNSYFNGGCKSTVKGSSVCNETSDNFNCDSRGLVSEVMKVLKVKSNIIVK